MTITDRIPAIPAKLRDGTWGAKVTGAENVALLITEAEGIKADGRRSSLRVTTRAGKTWNAVITKIVASDNDWALVTTRYCESNSDRNYGSCASFGGCGRVGCCE